MDDEKGAPFAETRPDRVTLWRSVSFRSGIFSTDSPMTAQLRCVMLKEKKLSLVHMDTEKKWQKSIRETTGFFLF